MKKKEYMFLVLSMGMIMMLTGCGNEQKVPETPVAVETETEVETEETKVGYEIIEVNKEYQAVTVTDTVLLDSSDAVTKIVDIEKDTYVTVYGDVLKDGVAVEYYAVELDDGTKGFIKGKHLNFNVAVENDYTENLEEIEGGDGEETETVSANTTEESTKEETIDLGYVLTECDPVTKYTNTRSNVRATPDKSGELINTVSINTEFTVTATTDTGWSRIESNGVVCFIKSSLLSDSKTEVKKPSSNSSKGSSSNSSQSSSNSSGGTPQPSGDWGFLNDYSTAGDIPVGSGNTGGTGAGGGMNVQ